MVVWSRSEYKNYKTTNAGALDNRDLKKNKLVKIKEENINTNKRKTAQNIVEGGGEQIVSDMPLTAVIYHLHCIAQCNVVAADNSTRFWRILFYEVDEIKILH